MLSTDLFSQEERSVIDIFDPKSLIYLSPDADDVLTELEAGVLINSINLKKITKLKFFSFIDFAHSLSYVYQVYYSMQKNERTIYIIYCLVHFY